MVALAMLAGLLLASPTSNSDIESRVSRLFPAPLYGALLTRRANSSGAVSGVDVYAGQIVMWDNELVANVYLLISYAKLIGNCCGNSRVSNGRKLLYLNCRSMTYNFSAVRIINAAPATNTMRV